MRRSKTATAVKYTFKALGLILVFGTIGILLWRVFTAGNPKDMENLSVNDALVEAWNEAEVEGRELTIYTPVMPDGSQITSVLGKNYSYFAVTHNVFIEEANQVQVLFRYNNSTIRHLTEDFGLAEMPAREEHLFDVTLVKTNDLTPNDTTDNTKVEALSFTRYTPNEGYLRDYSSLYSYYRYTFDGISVDDVTLGVFVDFFYVDAIDYNAEAYGTLCIYSNDCKWLPSSLTSADRAALGAWREEN